MPADASIYSTLQQPRINTPFESLSQILQLRNQQQAAQGLQEQRQALAAQERERTEGLAKQNEDRAALQQALSTATTPDEAITLLRKGGHGDLVATVQKQFSDADEYSTKARKAKLEAETAERDYFGHLAASVKSWEKDGPEAMTTAAQAAIEHAKKEGHDVSQWEQTLQQNPQALPRLLDGVIAYAQGPQKALTEMERAQLPGIQADTAVKQQVAAGTKGGITPEQQATNAIARGQLGVAQARERRESDAAQAASGASAQDVPPGSRDYRVAQDLASGDLTYSQFLRLYPSRSGAMAGKKAAIYDKARDLNPEFTPAAFESGYKFATNPKTVTAIAAVDNVLPNIKKLVDLSNSWDRTKYPDINRFLGSVQAKLGDTTVANIRQAQKLIGDELGTALGGGAMTDMKLQLGLDVVDPNLAPETFMSNMARVEEFLQNRKASLKTPMGHYANQNTGAPPATPPPAGAVEQWVRDPKTGKMVKKGGT
jgi:hypothetical protein